jgi:hypothetical protein
LFQISTKSPFLLFLVWICKICSRSKKIFQLNTLIFRNFVIGFKKSQCNCVTKISPLLFKGEMFDVYCDNPVDRVAHSVQRLATVWTVQGSNPGGGEIFRTCPDRSWGPPSLQCIGYRVFPGGRKRPERDFDPSPPSSAQV